MQNWKPCLTSQHERGSSVCALKTPPFVRHQPAAPFLPGDDSNDMHEGFGFVLVRREVAARLLRYIYEWCPLWVSTREKILLLSQRRKVLQQPGYPRCQAAGGFQICGNTGVLHRRMGEIEDLR